MFRAQECHFRPFYQGPMLFIRLISGFRVEDSGFLPTNLLCSWLGLRVWSYRLRPFPSERPLGQPLYHTCGFRIYGMRLGYEMYGLRFGVVHLEFVSIRGSGFRVSQTLVWGSELRD